jgi:hypothetical membrane protein
MTSHANQIGDQARPFPLAARHAATTTGQWAGLLLFLMAAQFMTVIMLAASVAPAYDYPGGAISDLGAIPETALLFNVSLLAVGVLNIAAGIALWQRDHHRRSLLAIYVVAGVGGAGAGLFPLGTSGLHGLFALVAFVAFNLEAIGTGLVVRGPMRAVSLLAGLTGLAFVVLMVVGDAGNAAVFEPIGHGGAERMIVYPVMLWLLGYGGWLMGTRSVGDGRQTGD